MLLAVSQAKAINCQHIPRIATGFGGGIGKQGETCGALSGGVVALGLMFGRDQPDQVEKKELANQKSAEFVRQFKGVNGALDCRDLTGINFNSDNALETYRERNLKENVCSEVVRNAVRIVLELIDEQPRIT